MTPPTTPSSPAAQSRCLSLALVAAAVAAMVLIAPGCYRKVVGARGVGAAAVDLEQPDNPHADRLHSKRRLGPLDRRSTGW